MTNQMITSQRAAGKKRWTLPEILLFNAFAFIVIIIFIFTIYRANFFYSFNSNEGWNALITNNIMDGAKIYFPLGGIPFTNNYPPLSFVIVAGVTYMIHDAVFA